MNFFLFSKKQVFVSVFVFITFSMNAQCAMCRAQLENMEDPGLAEGINDGIVYLMAVPYVLIALVGFIIYKGFKKKYASQESN